MKKITFLCIIIALVAQSCSNGKMFSHKRYGHLKWINHDTKVETTNNDVEISKAIKVDLSKPVITENPSVINSIENNEISTPIESSTLQKTEFGSNDAVEFEKKNENFQENSYPTQKENTNLGTPSITKEIKDTKEGSTGELLLMALLIALALILFFVLDSALGGILSLVLIIFLILVLLRYFGVI